MNVPQPTLPGSIRIDAYCPACYGTPAERWPQKLFIFDSNPLVTGSWYVCLTCNARIPWDQWLVAGGDFDIMAIGPIGYLPRLGDVINAIIKAAEPSRGPSLPPPGYIVKGPAYRRLHP